MKSVYGAVRTGALNKAVCASALKGLKKAKIFTKLWPSFADSPITMNMFVNNNKRIRSMHHTLYGTSSNFVSTFVSFKHVSSVLQLTTEFGTLDWRPLNRGSIQTQGGSLHTMRSAVPAS